MKYYFIREHINKDTIQVEWISTQDQQADILTKALGTVVFTKFLNQLMCE